MAANNVQTISNYKFVDARQTVTIGYAIPIICIVIVGMRFLTRCLQKNYIGIDDWLSAGSLFAIIGMGACLVAGAQVRVMGYPTPAPPANLTDDQLLAYLDPTSRIAEEIEFPFQILMMTAYGLIKLSVLAFYYRCFCPTKRAPFSIVCAVTAVLVMIWTALFILLIIFGCGTPIWANWGSPDARIQCPISLSNKHIGLMISDLLIDVFIICLPIVPIWKLHLSVQQKIGVTGVILLGAAAVAASIARVVVYVKLLAAFPATIGVDTNQAITVQLYWCLLEAGLALIAACLPSVHWLFKPSVSKPVISKARVALGLSPLDLTPKSAKKGSTTQQSSIRGRYPGERYTEIEAGSAAGSHDDRDDAKFGYTVHEDEYTMRDLEGAKRYRL